jgi:hypothetical protein
MRICNSLHPLIEQRFARTRLEGTPRGILGNFTNGHKVIRTNRLVSVANGYRLGQVSPVVPGRCYFDRSRMRVPRKTYTSAKRDMLHRS